MNLQRISFQREQGGKWELGVAKVKHHGIMVGAQPYAIVVNGAWEAFKASDVEWIIDQQGQRVNNIMDYKLMEGEMAYMTV